MKIFENL